MKGKDLFWLILVIAFLWCVVSAAKPYWDRHWLGKSMEAAAIYGTKHSMSETRKFLTKKMREEGWNFDGNDFVIEKSRNNTVSVRLTYEDEIRIFGHTFKELVFTVERSAEEVETMF